MRARIALSAQGCECTWDEDRDALPLDEDNPATLAGQNTMDLTIPAWQIGRGYPCYVGRTGGLSRHVLSVVCNPATLAGQEDARSRAGERQKLVLRCGSFSDPHILPGDVATPVHKWG